MANTYNHNYQSERYKKVAAHLEFNFARGFFKWTKR